MRILMPENLDTLWRLIAAEPEAPLFAGGTDLLVKIRSGKVSSPVLICLEKIEELRTVREEDDYVRIGAGVTHASLLGHPLIRECFPVLTAAVGMLGSPQIRNMGTIGGNICTASPAGDALPPLFVLRAEVEILSAEAMRILPISSFITGPGRTDLKKGEALAAIRISKPEGFGIHHFEKVGKRRGMAIAVASLAALVNMAPDGTIREARFAWGSLGPGIVTSPEVESFVCGERCSMDLFRSASALVEKAVDPIDDVRGTADYRRAVAGRLLIRLAAVKGEA